MIYDIIGIIELLLVIWALIGILQSSASPVEKLIWVLIILIIPLVGFLLWYLIGPGSKSFPLRR
jgi:Phospholipase_D-nuclease N-terminal